MVRLVSESLVGVEDALCGVVGLVGVGCVRVGFGCGRVVGFPGWVVVHDPEGAGLALGLVGDLGRVARLAGSRPGRAMGVLEIISIARLTLSLRQSFLL